MTRSQISETSPEHNQEIRVNRIQSKIPKGYTVAFSHARDGRSYLVCYNGKEKDHTKAYVEIEA